MGNLCNVDQQTTAKTGVKAVLAGFWPFFWTFYIGTVLTEHTEHINGTNRN
jgi:hypothetical protein